MKRRRGHLLPCLLFLFAALQAGSCSRAISTTYSEFIVPENWLADHSLAGLQAVITEIAKDGFYNQMAFRFPDISPRELQAIDILTYQESAQPGAEGNTKDYLLIVKVEAENTGDLERAKKLGTHGQELLVNALIARLDPRPEDIEHNSGLIGKLPNRASSYFHRARALAKTGDFGKANWDLDVAIGIDSTQAVYFEERAGLLLSRGDSIRAGADSDWAKKLRTFRTAAFDTPPD